MTTIAEPPPTIAQLPFYVSGRYPKPDLIGGCRAGGVTLTSGRELLDRVRDLSLGLSALGMHRGDRVALLSESGPEWLVTDLSILAAGAVTVPIYPTLSTPQVAFILRDSDASLAVVSTPTQLAKTIAAAEGAPALRTIIAMHPPAPDLPAFRSPILTLTNVIDLGHRQILDGWGVGRTFHDEAKKVKPSDIATLIYTSGTTAEPKGVMLTHGNLVANVGAVRAVLHVDEEDVALSFLPLCHAFERLVAYFYLTSGVSVVFAESFDTVARDLCVVRPTVMTGVPRLFEKLHAHVLAAGRGPGGFKRVIFDWSVRVAEARGRGLEGGKALPSWRALEWRLADRLVFRRVREGVGGRLRFAVSGSAPLRADIGRFFYGVGLPILEGYGLTETSPVLAVVTLEDVRFGTVGRALSGVGLKIADDGEILARGPNVMAGYYRQPDATADAMRDGWFHTGDLGTIDADGFLRITGRKKEIIVTSGGKKIVPQPIETALRNNALVADAVLVGEGRRFPALLIVSDLGLVSQRLGIDRPNDPAHVAAFVERADVRALYQAVVDAVNAPLAQFERIKRFAILHGEFSIDAGELTPTMKVKRRVIEQKYKDTIETLYRIEN